mmetsp:Transcript_43643/g.69951  ORF Transcript_43643/g.69951 Transcript_43643/m.69951 type:complete len:157 (-) Transcript_43643:544-1014(-)|eukprot:CAMPEP_0197031624 /NCGR_PEP_ID=MMETSP1384-20130603/10580_1 /TAXON_ID=29189 /ORGANISM="Ammonia sp." /LENGTH=156 /DNA_ID=CAMNT_0042461181 /DNA_START=12 /DNA_END=482 /DNA_ORIENTATION=-
MAEQNDMSENEKKAQETREVIEKQKEELKQKAADKKERSLANAQQKREERIAMAKQKFYDPEKPISEQEQFSAMQQAFDYIVLLCTGKYDKLDAANKLIAAEKGKYGDKHPLQGTVNLFNDIKSGKKTAIQPDEVMLDNSGMPDDVVAAIKAQLGY